MVSITQFNRGQATKIFSRVKNEGEIIVLKNNEPEAVIISPEEYIRMSEIIQDHALLLLAEERLANHHKATELSHEQVLSEFGLTQTDLDSAGEIEIE
jgi:PHD/YefM family antitoxin component YafN of YafNO toxin-antitoxin module